MPGHAGGRWNWFKKVDSIIQSIIKRRNRLGWSNTILAKNSKVPSSAIGRIINRTGYWEDYVLQIDSSLNKAIKSLCDKKEKNIENNKSIKPTNDNVFANRIPLGKRGGWALCIIVNVKTVRLI